MLAIVGYYEEWWIQILKAIVIFAVGLQLVPVVLLAERKLLGRFQARYGRSAPDAETEQALRAAAPIVRTAGFTGGSRCRSAPAAARD